MTATATPVHTAALAADVIATGDTMRKQVRAGNSPVEGARDAVALWSAYLAGNITADEVRECVGTFERLSVSRYRESREYGDNALATLRALINL